VNCQRGEQPEHQAWFHQAGWCLFPHSVSNQGCVSAVISVMLPQTVMIIISSGGVCCARAGSCCQTIHPGWRRPGCTGSWSGPATSDQGSGMVRGLVFKPQTTRFTWTCVDAPPALPQQTCCFRKVAVAVAPDSTFLSVVVVLRVSPVGFAVAA
jgi:hypothetical protein